MSTQTQYDHIIRRCEEMEAHLKTLSPDEAKEESKAFFIKLGMMDDAGNWIGPYAVLGK